MPPEADDFKPKSGAEALAWLLENACFGHGYREDADRCFEKLYEERKTITEHLNTVNTACGVLVNTMLGEMPDDAA